MAQKGKLGEDMVSSPSSSSPPSSPVRGVEVQVLEDKYYAGE